MKKMAVLLAGAMLMVGMATAAQALPLSLTISDGTLSRTIFDGGAGDADLNAGAISINNLAFSTYNINVNSATGLSQPAISWPEALHLNGLEVKSASTPKGSLTFTLSNSALILPNVLAISPNAELEYYISAATQNGNTVNNSVKINGITVGTQTGVAVNRSFSADNFVMLDVTTPFSIDQIIKFDFVTTGTSSFDAGTDIIPTPEPGTMVLLGAGLLGLAIYGKRRMNKEA